MAPVSSTQVLTSTTEPSETVVAALAAERPGSPAADIAPATKATPEPGPVDKPADKPAEVKPAAPTTPAEPAKVEDPAPPVPPPADADPDADDASLSPEEEASNAGRVLSNSKKKYKQRLDKLLKDRRERDVELAKLRSELAKVKPVEEPGAVDPDETPIAEPLIDNFDTNADHMKAMLEWDRQEQARKGRIEAKAKAKVDAKAAAEEADKTAYETMVTNFVKSRDTAKSRYADWDEVMESAKNLFIADKPVLQNAISESDLAGDLLYHFGQHPEAFDEIVALGPGKGLMALGRLEDKIRARVGGLVVASPPPAPSAETVPAVPPAPAAPPRPATPPVPVSKAPEPMPSVGAGATSTTTDPNVMTHAQFKAWRAAGGGR